MGYMSVEDENFPRAQGVLRGKYCFAEGSWEVPATSRGGLLDCLDAESSFLHFEVH